MLLGLSAQLIRERRFREVSMRLADAKRLIEDAQYEALREYHTSGIGPI